MQPHRRRNSKSPAPTGRYGPAENFNERDTHHCRQCRRLLAGWLAGAAPDKENKPC